MRAASHFLPLFTQGFAKLVDGKAKDPVVVGTPPVCAARFCLTQLRVGWYETVITL